MNADEIARRLTEAAEQERSRTDRHVRSLRGLRGAPQGAVARVATDAWASKKWTLPKAEEALEVVFSAAWEDGLVAIGLLAANVPDRPQDALEIAQGWLLRTDDTTTADALGWLVIGPAALASRANLAAIAEELKGRPRPEQRRAAVMMAMAALPEPVEGASAAPLRARVGTKDVMFVEHPIGEVVGAIATIFVRDDDPTVRKGLRRVLGTWAAVDPDAAEAWLEAVRGGAHRMFRDAIEASAKKARRAR